MSKQFNKRALAAMFLWGMIASYFLAAGPLYHAALEGYTDFSTFYTAAKIVREGRVRELYDWEVQTRIQREFSHAAFRRDRALPYMRPPFHALLFLPLSYLSYTRAFQIWFIVSLLLVTATAVTLRSRMPGFSEVPWWIYYPSFFSFCPTAYGLATGQDFGFMMVFFAMVTVCLRQSRNFMAGCFLGVSLIKFQLVLPIVFILLLKKQWRVLSGFLLVAVFLSGASGRVLGWDRLVTYPEFLWELNSKRVASGVSPEMMPSVRGLVQTWWHPLQSFRSLDVVTAVLSFSLLCWAVRQWNTDAPRQSKTYLGGVAITLIAGLLAGYHVFIYDMCLLMPVILWSGLVALRDQDLDRGTRYVLLATVGIAMFPPLYLGLIDTKMLSLLTLDLLMLAWGLARAVKRWTSVGSAVLLSDLTTGATDARGRIQVAQSGVQG